MGAKVRFCSVLCLTAFAFASTAPSMGVAQAVKSVAVPPRPPAAAPGPAPAAPAPVYVVVEGSHTEEASPRQQLTVVCPATHAALGAGFGGVVRDPKTRALQQIGVDGVRSIPDSAGHGWQVEASAPNEARAGRPWRLVVRVTCLRMAG